AQDQGAAVAEVPEETPPEEEAGGALHAAILRTRHCRGNQAPQPGQIRSGATPALASSPASTPASPRIEAGGRARRSPRRVRASLTGDHGALRDAGHSEGSGCDGAIRVRI